MSELIATFEKNSREEVRVSIDEYMGKKLVNIRVFYKPEKGGEMLPGKQGIAVSIDRYRELAEAILKVGEKLRADGLLR